MPKRSSKVCETSLVSETGGRGLDLRMDLADRVVMIALLARTYWDCGKIQVAQSMFFFFFLRRVTVVPDSGLLAKRTSSINCFIIRIPNALYLGRSGSAYSLIDATPLNLAEVKHP